jgi:hypothetical protein
MKTALTDLLGTELPIIMAPMFLVTNVDMMVAAGEAGIAGCIPALNFRTIDDLEKGLKAIKDKNKHAMGVNLIVNKSNIHAKKQLHKCLDMGVDFFITSLGSPEEVIREAKSHGVKVFCDVTDEKYAKILNRLRVGEVTKKGLKELEKCVNKKVDKDNNPTILMPLRKSADIINNIEYNKLDKTSEHIYELKTVDDIDIKTDKSMCNGLWSDDDKIYEQQLLTNSVMVDKIINLRIGTVVMCVVNLNTNIYNGSKGVVIDFIENNPLVKFNNITLLITPHVWQSEKIQTIGIKQLPLIYAWAITIHKSQGMTLDTAYIDIGNFIFECGQTYVALSRVKTLDGLYLKNLDISRVTVNMKVKNFYNNLDNQKNQS